MNKQNTWTFLNDLPKDFTYGVKPATDEQIEIFKKKSIQLGVNENVIKELISLYRVANPLDFEIIMSFHPCEDEIIFEWWEDGVLWLGQRDFNTLRWVDGKFCLGDAGNYSYSKENEYDTLVNLVQGCIKEIRELDDE